MPDLIIKFTDQSESFAYGVEFGRLLARMERAEEIISNGPFPVRIENKEVLTQACREYGYMPRFGTIHFGEWIEFTCTKQEKLN